jgi:hypothetical protein
MRPTEVPWRDASHRLHRRNQHRDRGCSVDGVRDVVAGKQEASAVAQRCDEFAVAVEQPLSVDRGQVGDSTLVVEPYGVALGGLLSRSVLVIVGTLEVEHVADRLVGSVEPKVCCVYVDRCDCHVS